MNRFLSKTFWHEKLWLIWTLAIRNYSQRYKGSLLGFLWPFASMFAMLLIYSLVFSVILQARWQNLGIDAPVQEAPFWLVLFTGLVLYQLLSETMIQAPGTILTVPNYVKKIKFPLAILPVVNYLGSFFNALIGMAILIIAAAVLGFHHWTALLAPLVLLQLTFWCLGFGWLLSALGVYFRDLLQLMSLITLMLLFVTPILYPPHIIPPQFRIFVDINPLAYLVEMLRGLILWGQLPQWLPFILWTLGSMLFALVGFKVFQRLRSNFADIM